MSTMRAMVLDRPQRRSCCASGRFRSRRGRNPDRGRGLRRLPHRSARGRRRTARSEAADRAGPRDCRPRGCDRAGVRRFALGARVGVPWLAAACGVCPYCRSGRENLCDAPVFTGYTRDGGYATHIAGDARFSFPLPRKSRCGGNRAAAVRRPDRLALLSHGRDRARRSASTASAQRPTFWRPGRDLARPARFCLHASGRQRLARFRALARRGLGRQFRRAAAGAARCGDHLRAGRGARAGWRSRR